MKRSELFFGAVLVPIDFLALLTAGAAAYFLRTSDLAQAIRPAVFEVDLPLTLYMELTAAVAAVIVAVFAAQGLYVMQSTRRVFDEVSRIFTGISLGMLLVILYMFLSAELFQSRFILLVAYVISIFVVTLGRYVVRRLQVFMLQQGVGVHRVVLVGGDEYTAQITGIVEKLPRLGYRVVGAFDSVKWNELEDTYRRHGIDEIIQTDSSLEEEDSLILIDFCDKYKIDFKYVPNLFETHATRVRYKQIGNVPIVELLRTPLDGWGRVAKRIMDMFGVLVGLVFLWPLFLVTAIAIKLESNGTVLYRQMRVGRNQQPFYIYKFRSMYWQYCTGQKYGGDKAAKYEESLKQNSNERQDGPLFKMRRDPRITKVGRFIRRWRIDELPQLINVAKGEMSLMGPRPHLPHEVAKYNKHHRALFTIKPGVSGMAQVSGNAGLTFEQEANLDISYIENWSLKLDVILLLKTLSILVTDKNAV